MRRLLVPALVSGFVVLGGPGCGADGDSPLGEVADRLADIRSGTLSMRFSLKPAGSDQEVGVSLAGPFSLESPGALPVARVTYLRKGGTATRATFISTGREAYVETAGQTVKLPADRLTGLRLGSGEAKTLDDLGLHVDRWIDDPETSPGPRLDDHETERTRGSLDAAAALADFARLTGGAAGLSEQDAKRLSRTVSDSSIEVVAGKDDHLLRRVRITIDLSVPPDLRKTFGGRAGLRVLMRMGVSRVNEPVRVSAPRAAQPLP